MITFQNYIKQATKQDFTRTPVLNKSALDYFFCLNLKERDDFHEIKIVYKDDQMLSEIVKIQKKQDYRIYIKRVFEIGDILHFEKQSDTLYTLRSIKPLHKDFSKYLQQLKDKKNLF